MAFDKSLTLKRTVSWKEKDEWVNANVDYEMKNNQVIVHPDKFKTPNISSHVLVNLCGLNRFATVGSTLLSTFGLLERKPIPLYQSIKGNIVEEFATRYLEELYGGRYNIESFTLEQFSGYNQFPEQKPFSGALDKLIKGDVILPVEIKSKEMKDHKKIAIDGKYPKDQLIQGANQAYMYGAEKFMMLYGFLSKDISDILKDICKSYTTIKRQKNALGMWEEVEVEETLWIWGKDYAQAIEDLGLEYEDIVFHHEVMDFDPTVIENYRRKAKEIYDDFAETGIIDRYKFNKDELLDIMKQVKN